MQKNTPGLVIIAFIATYGLLGWAISALENGSVDISIEVLGVIKVVAHLSTFELKP